MRRREAVARWQAGLLAAALLVVVGAASTEFGGEVRRPGSFVAPTLGRHDALTLTTFLTDAADLHYAVVRSGHAPLGASDIKKAAEKTTEPPNYAKDQVHRHPGDFGRQSGGGAGNSDAGVVRASTITIPRAQKVETVIQALSANASYDVYFVAEVIGSNGVFGPVQSVLMSTTHPEPPVIEAVTIAPANATADVAIVRLALSTPGKVYIALRPSGGYAAPLTHEELSTSRSLDVSHQPTFALQEVTDWGQLKFNKSVAGLLPSTLYDAFIVAEAPGGGNVRGEMMHIASAVRTHSLPPELRTVRATPKNGTAFALDVSFQLEFHPQDLLRVTPDVLPFFGFNIYYEAVIMSGANTSTASAASTKESAASVPRSRPTSPGKSPAKEEIKMSATEELDSAIRGKMVFGNFSTVEQLQYEIAQTQVVTVEGLANGTEYQVTLVAEMVGSNGLFSLRRLSSPVTTHEVAPIILSAGAEPSIGSVDALTVKVNMSRPGNIHYLVMKGRTPAVHELLRATSISQLHGIVSERGHLDEPAKFGVIGLEDDKSRVMTNGSERTKSGDYSRTFQIDGLHDATHYSVIVIPETIGSFGVFGTPYQKIMDVVTHENASEVELVGLRPLLGSTSSIEVQLRMTKTSDVLYFCVEGGLNATVVKQREHCEEADRTSFELVHHQQSDFRFTIANLTEDTEFTVSLFAESALRNRVYSNRSLSSVVRTHRRAPRIVHALSKPLGGSTSTVETDMTLERGCFLHYLVRPAIEANDDRVASSADFAIKEANDVLQFTDPTAASRLHHNARASITSSGRVFSPTDSPSFQTTGLAANTTYELYIVTETSYNGDSSGVLSDLVVVNVTTYAKAPTLVKATVDPVAGTTDSVVIAANLSHPGIIHYFLSDADFADPAVIRSPVGAPPSSSYTPHTMRGEFVVLKSNIYLEIINGTNDTGPTDPPMYVKNLTLTELKSGATYHVSLTTETFDSDGVFGEFPPPILVSSHLPAPRIIPDTLKVQPTLSSSSSIDITMRLDRFGEVHYALFFRGLIPDRSETVFAAQRAKEEEERRRKKIEMIALGTFNASNYSDELPNPWPPVSSSFNLLRLDGPLLKSARLEDLGAGVWDNGSISVSREDVIKGKLIHKKLEKLPPNAMFDVCLVSETAGGSDVFNWNSSESNCHRVVTHADYTNQSILFDEVEVSPIPGRTDGILVKLHVSKLPNAPSQTQVSANGSVLLEGFAASTGRTPRFILIDGKESRQNFDHNSFTSSHRGREIGAAFNAATPGQGGVAATGTISTVAAENDTFITLERDIYGLKQNTPYVFFFAYETVNSGGVFTKINPHKHRPNDPRSENDGIEITTHEEPPRLSRAEASPTFGNASSVTVKFDITCDACDRAIVHILAYPEGCSAPSTALLLPKSAKNRNINNDEANAEVCGKPLAKRKVKIAMPERQHSRKDVEEDISGNMAPNTSYAIFIATETVNSNGVMSDHFEKLSVRTHAVAPSFRSLQLMPRKGSTTELLLQFKLDGPGEIHYMLGQSGNPEFNATSALNISSKSTGGGRHHKSGPNFHDYERDVVRLRRSVKIEPSGLDVIHTEVLDYLSPGTAYDAYVVVEAAGENGVYGSIEHFREVATFSNAPILLAHAANPTPGTTDSLTVGFRLDAPGSIYFSVVSVGFWDRSQRVAYGSDKYGNRLAVQEKLVARENMEIKESTMQVTGPGSRDSGWREKALQVPYAGANYTVYIVTETADSGGVYGIVATHQNVQSHAVAPHVLNLTVTATDARMDSLTIAIRLSGAGHVHYAAVVHDQAFILEELDSQSSTGIGIHRGVVNVNMSTCADSNASDCAYISTFEIESLKEGTTYDVYVRTETLNSFGVFGEWRTVPATARTHGLPPAVLHELKCHVTPSCETLHRETCSRAPNVCGDCLDGFVESSSHSMNEPCANMVGSINSDTVSAESAQAPRTPRIKINGVILNPQLELGEELAVVEDDDGQVLGEPEVSESNMCPMNAQPIPSGGCECLPGFEIDAIGTSCVLPELPTVASVITAEIPFEERTYSPNSPSRDSRRA